MKEFILEVKKVLPTNICKKVIDYYDDDKLNLAGFGENKHDRNTRNCETRDILQPTTFGQRILSNYIKRIFFGLADEYQKKHLHYHYNKISQLDLLKYEANEYDAGYKYHIDHGARAPERSISISLCLNNDFEGGEFNFDFGREHMVPQNIGDALVFPSSFMFPHKVHKINKGTRYALIGWIV
tara:strand:+ start:1681 stop:2229 length:549 start_codon:yes stop_codon:yes gene_type:complete